MTTPAPTPVQIVVTDPIPQIIAMLENVRRFLPMFAMWIPKPYGSVIEAGIPIIEEALQAFEDAKSKSGLDLVQAIGSRIQTIGQHVQTTASTAAKLPAPVASEGLPNA